MCSVQQCCPLLRDVTTYQPDTFNLYKDAKAAEYWFPCFRELSKKFEKQAAASQENSDVTAVERARQFQSAYLADLEIFQRLAMTKAKRKIDDDDGFENTQRSNEKLASSDSVQSGEVVSKTKDKNEEMLGIRELLELNDKHLRNFGFQDPWLQQKRIENEAAVSLFKKRLQEIDDIRNADARWTELVRGVLAGNMFDWGAQAVTNILENDKDFGLHAALDRIEKRPWLTDNLDEWLERLRKETTPHKCAVIFVDNSGVDIVLGILPFARELLKRGTKVLLCANTEPSLNDVTSTELNEVLNKCKCFCDVLANALTTERLLVYGNGQHGPCLDMRSIPNELCDAIETNETDLLVIEGMGRALHTNLYAKFNCETLKLAVIKNKWLAQQLGGDTFAVLCKYETPTIITNKTKTTMS